MAELWLFISYEIGRNGYNGLQLQNRKSHQFCSKYLIQLLFGKESNGGIKITVFLKMSELWPFVFFNTSINGYYGLQRQNRKSYQLCLKYDIQLLFDKESSDGINITVFLKMVEVQLFVFF